MSISFLILTLALGNGQYDVYAQAGDDRDYRAVYSEAGVTQLAARGNPWALPVAPEPDYSGEKGRENRPAMAAPNTPRYITPEELKSLEKPPQTEVHSGPWDPLGANTGKGYRFPLHDGAGYPGYYPGGAYGAPAYPGIDPLLDPYGAYPYGGVPYQGLLPFIY